MNLFGKKKNPAQASQASSQLAVDAIRDLRSQLTILEKREALMNQRIIQATKDAIEKKNKKDTKGALFELKRKKMFEKEVEKLQGARITLDSQIMALESATTNMETFKAMQTGANAMKSIHGNLDVDKVDDLMESIEEQTDLHNTISEAISRPGQEMFDDDELLQELQELDELESEEAQSVPVQGTVQSQAAPTTVFNFPVAPSGNIKVPAQAQESEEERVLRELEASMMS